MGGLTLEDVYRIPFLSDPQLSPDATWVAFVVTQADRESDENRSTIWVVPADGSEPARALTAGPHDSSPRWSPDGEWLAFVAARGEAKPQIWLLPTGGGEARSLTSVEAGASTPVWSPDGGRLAFLSAVGPEVPKGKPPPVVIRTLRYKGDGSGLIGERRTHLLVTDLDGSVTRLTEGDFSVGTPAWSPDGSRLTFASQLHPDHDLDASSHVFVVDASGGTPAGLTEGENQAAEPRFTPDGQSIVFAGSRYVGVGHSRLFRVPVGGGEPAELAEGLDRNVMVGAPAYPGGPPQVTGDGSTVVFCARDGGGSGIFRAPVAGGPATKLFGHDAASVSGLSLGRDGRTIAFVAADTRTCGEVSVGDIDAGAGAGSRAVTAMVAGALGDVTLLEPEPRRFSAPDGTQVHGWVLRDPASGPGRQPLLLDIHGGPHNAWSPTFDGVHLYHQVLALRGWTVLYINPRGSDGYGEAFYTALVKEGWGASDTADFMAAVDSVVEEGLADPDRLAVTGYSYGGYMTCWLTGHTTRFAAAVAGGCVSDLASFSGGSDIGPMLATHELGALAWEDPERLATQSPWTFVGEVSTPTLLQHGADDLRCPVGQAEQWFSALRSRRVPTEMVLYPGVGHLFIVSGPPSYRVDWCQRIVDWVEAHAGARSSR